MVGNRIRRRRIQLGMTQQDLADAMGYKSRTTINKIEMNINDMTAETLQKFAQVLNCDVKWLLDIEDNKPRDEMVELFDSLSEESKKEAMKYMIYLYEKETNKRWVFYKGEE